MGLFQGVLEGVAQAAGSQGTVDRIEKKKAEKQAMSHAELKDQTQSVLNDVTGLQQKRSTLDPNSPTYKDDVAANDKALHDARQTLQDLYHPEKNPGALAHLGGFIRAHIGKQEPQAATPGSIKQDMASRISGLDAAASPSATDSNPYAKEKKQLIDLGWSAEDADKAIRHKTGVDKTAKVSDYAQGLKRFVQGEGGDPENPTAAQEQAYREQRHKDATGSNSKFSQEASVYENKWGKKVKDWSPEQLTYFNQKMAYDAQHSGSSTTTRLEKDEYGNIRPVEITSTHGPMRPPVEPGQGGGDRTPAFTPPANPQGLKVKGNIDLGNRPILHNPGGSISSERSFSIGTDQGEVLIPRIYDGKDHTEKEAIEHYKQTGQHMGIFDTPEHADAYAQAIHNRSIPRTAGEAKARMAPNAPHSSVKVGDALPFKGSTPAITKAQNDVTEATKLSTVADQVAHHPNDAVNQKRLAVALERASAGRFTTQALDYILKAGWGNTIEQWANNPSTGALPTDIMRQLVDGAHQNLTGAKAALVEAQGPAQGGATPPAPSGKAVSLAKAKLLPQNKGKSDDEIRKDIEAHGHAVTN